MERRELTDEIILLKGLPYSQSLGLSEPTIFSVIGRKYDEDLISRVVAYVLESDTSLVKKLIKYYISKKETNNEPLDLENISQIKVKCEQATDNGRIDIFVQVKGAQRDITITIENKIKTWEHNTKEKSQTEEYAEFVNSYYQNSFNTFLYLTPDWNHSEPKSAAFAKITYSKLLELMSDTGDQIIDSFRKHIEIYLTEEMAMLTNTDEYLMRNYLDIKAVLDGFETRITNLKTDIAEAVNRRMENLFNVTIPEWSEEIVKRMREDDLYCEKVNENGKIGMGSYRLSRIKWYKENEYYFYVEIRYDNGLMRDIYYQITLRREDGKKKKGLSEFLTKTHFEDNIKNYYVLRRKKSNVIVDAASDSWKEALIDEAAKLLPVCLEEMDEIFQLYQIVSEAY